MTKPYRCGVCTQPMEKVDSFTWMCDRCAVKVSWYTLDAQYEEDARSYLQREWETQYDELPQYEVDES